MASLKFHICWLIWTFIHLCVDISTAQEVSSGGAQALSHHSSEKFPRMLRRRDKVEHTTQETGPGSQYQLPEVDTIPQPHWPEGSEFELVAKESTDDVLYLGDTSDTTSPSDKPRERLGYVKTQGPPTTRTSNQEALTVGLLQGQDSLITQTRNTNTRTKIRTGVNSHSFQTLRTSTDSIRTVNSDRFDNPLGSTYQVTDGIQIQNALKSKAANPKIETIGGVGNPALQGMPLSLDDAVFLIQSERTVTAKPIYGGIGAEFLPLSVDIGEIGPKNPNKRFFTISNKGPYHLAPAPNPSEFFPNFSAGHPDKTSAQNLLPATNSPVSIRSLINIVRNLTSQTRINSITSTPSPYVVNPHVQSFPEYTNDLPNFSFSQQSSFQPLETRINIQEENLHDYLKREYGENIKHKQIISFEDVIPLLQHSPAFQNSINHLSNVSSNRELPLSSSFKESDESAIGINSSIQGCLKDTWCGLGIAAAVALGTVSALAVPFLTPPVFGRRRKSIEYVIFSTDTASSFVKHYMSMLQNSTRDVPDSERLFFIGLHDSKNNSTRDAFDKVKDLILRNKDALLAIKEQQIENTKENTNSESNDKNQILIPDNILNIIQEKSEDHQTKFPNEDGANNDEDGRTSVKDQTILSQIQLLNIPTEFPNNPTQTLQDHFPSNFHDSTSTLPKEWVQNEVTDIKLNKSDSEILDSYSAVNPRLRVPTTHYIQIQKIGNNAVPFSNPYQLHQNEMHTFSTKVSQHEPLGSSGSILQRLSDILAVNAGQSHTQDSLSLQENFPINNIASQFSYNSKYSPINIGGYPLPGRRPLTSNSNFAPFSSFGLNQRPGNIAGSYTSLPNNQVSDLRNTAVRNTLPVPSNSGSSTELLPQKVQSQSSSGYPSILLNLPMPFMPTHQVNQLNHVNSNQIPQHSKPHLPNSQSISNLLNRITRYPSRLNEPVRGTTSTNPSGKVQHSSSLSHQIPHPSQTGPFQVSSSSSPRPILSNKVSQLFTSNPYNSNSYLNPASSSLGNPQVIPLKNTGVNTSIHAKGFYQSVCSAVGQRDVPDSDIIRFIREKCTIFQYTGII